MRQHFLNKASPLSRALPPITCKPSCRSARHTASMTLTHSACSPGLRTFPAPLRQPNPWCPPPRSPGRGPRSAPGVPSAAPTSAGAALAADAAGTASPAPAPAAAAAPRPPPPSHEPKLEPETWMAFGGFKNTRVQGCLLAFVVTSLCVSLCLSVCLCVCVSLSVWLSLSHSLARSLVCLLVCWLVGLFVCLRATNLFWGCLYNRLLFQKMVLDAAQRYGPRAGPPLRKVFEWKVWCK